VKSNKLWDWITFGVFFFSLSILLWVTIKTATAEQLTGTSRFVAEDFFRGKLYELNDGEYFQTGRDCEILDDTDVLINNTGKYEVAYYAFSGEQQSTVHWETSESRTKDCDTEDCSQAVIEYYTQWQVCNITGLIGGANITSTNCVETYPVFIEGSLQYYIPNTHIFNGYRDTGRIIPEVVLQYNSDNSCFGIKEINQ